MLKLDLEKYSDVFDNKYYDASYLILILERNLGKSLTKIKDTVNSAQVSVTGDMIKEFLDSVFQKEDFELKERIERNIIFKTQRDIGKLEFTSIEWTNQEIEKMTQEFADRTYASRYQFEPYTLEYFNRYISIVKNKALKLLNIIELIGTRQSSLIRDLLLELDIQLDEKGNIRKEDIIRLIKPTIQNIGELGDKVSKANDLSTYLTFKMSRRSIYRDGFSEGEIYPTKSILVKDLNNGYRYGNVPISKRQEQELREKYEKNLKSFTKCIF